MICEFLASESYEHWNNANTARVKDEMSKKDDRTPQILLAAFLVLFPSMYASGQGTQDVKNLRAAPTPSTHSIEDLNYLGGDAAMPSLSDSIIEVDCIRLRG
jgi:hypothetical protein